MASNLPTHSPRAPEANHSRGRPTEQNFLPNQSAGPANDPVPPFPRPSPCPSVAAVEQDLMDLILGDSDPNAIYPPSLDADTNSTLSAHTLVNKELKSRLDSMSWILDNNTELDKQPLTSIALQAHELGNEGRGYHRDLAGWCQDGTMFVRHDAEARLTDSMLMPQKAKSHATDFTSSSYDMLPEFPPPNDMDRDINGAGAAFHDVASPQLDFDLDVEM